MFRYPSGGGNPLEKYELVTEFIEENCTFKAPYGVLNNRYDVRIFGGGGGANTSGNYSCGGGGGWMNNAILTLNEGENVDIIIGLGGNPGKTGGTTSFGSYLSANGGTHAKTSGNKWGGNGGAGGGARCNQSSDSGSTYGGIGYQFGGGGAYGKGGSGANCIGGNGGKWGGGGGSYDSGAYSGTHSPGIGGEFGGNGGYYMNYQRYSFPEYGTNTIGIENGYLAGAGLPGPYIYVKASGNTVNYSNGNAGGGGGYGGNGGAWRESEAGGGGGYGAKGGHGNGTGCGGGGCYGRFGKGGNGSNDSGFISSGGGAYDPGGDYYTVPRFGGGGGGRNNETRTGFNGVCIIQYYKLKEE